jgi:hypothetical protein
MFRYLPNDEKNPNMEGWFRVDSSLNSVIRDYEIKVTHHAFDQARKLVSQISGSILYKVENGTPVPVEVNYKEEHDNQVQHRRFVDVRTYEINRFVLGPTPAAEFTLAAFGLGDFERPSARSTSRGPYLLLVIAGAALFLSLVLSRLARSRWIKRADAPVVGGPT